MQDALGFAVVEPEKIEAKIDTIYDLASLTKPLVTGLLCAKLIEQNKLELDAYAEDYLMEYAFLSGTDSSDALDTFIKELLTHSSAFPAWKPFYLLAKPHCKDSRKEVFFKLLKIDGVQEPDVIYSDLNFLMLTFLLEKTYGKRLDEIAKEEIFEPLNLQTTFYNPPKELQKRIAASEKGNEYEKQMCVDLGYDISKYDWRDYQIWGEVHDGNCYFMNGVSGHAGLFSTAEETCLIAQQFLANQTKLLKPETCDLFRTNFTSNLNEARSVAFQLAETKDSTASLSLSKDSFGHLGFTGTSLWVDPSTERIFILLTNRTHARRLPFANINSARRKFHEIAAKSMDER